MERERTKRMVAKSVATVTTRSPKNLVRRRWAALVAIVGLLPALTALPAAAIAFDDTDEGVIKVPTTAACPTLESPPRPYEAWFNMDDMEVRGFYDPINQTPWDFPKKIAQILCGAREGAEIKIGMYFIRAIGTMKAPGLDGSDEVASLGSRPESDPEVIYDALEFLVKKRGVKVGIVLDGGSITSASAKALINKRLLDLAELEGFAKTDGIEWCINGCFNTNTTSTYPYAINHEKFVTISDTIWDGSGKARTGSTAKPVLISSSGNFARSQTRNYLQEVTVIYDDDELSKQFDARYDGMADCANTGCPTNVNFPTVLKTNLGLDRKIWVDRLNPHGTDAGRGTYVTFSPQPSTVTDSYIAAFDNVDCTVDKRIRIAMFKLTDSKAVTMVKALSRLKARGCDIKMLLTQQGGATQISATVVSLLKKASIPVKCTSVAMHTKMILIGPALNNNGRVFAGTANMSTAGLRYSEEHTLTLDSRRASPQYQEDLRRVYGVYLAGWYELNQGSLTCKGA